MKFIKYFFIILIIIQGSAEARVFDMNRESVAAYFRGGYGLSSIEKSAYEDSSGNNVSIDDGVSNIYNGEFGFALTSSRVSWRFGFEIVSPTAVSTKGKDGSGVELYKLRSDISAVAPKVGIEINFKQTPTWRIFMMAGYGQASFKMTNKYEFTADGLSAFPGMADYTEDVRATVNLIDLMLGYEHLMSDATTIVFETGYRQCEVSEMKHNDDYTTFDGAVEKGDVARNSDASQKKLSLTGAYVSIGFRFYIK